MLKPKKDILSTTVFIFSSVIIILSLVSIVFPALLVRLTSGSSISAIEPFELGIFSIPLLIINSIFLILYLLYNRNLLPEILYIIINKIMTFEVSERIGLVILFAMVVIYAGISTSEIFVEKEFADYKFVLYEYNVWLSHDDFQKNLAQLHTKMFFLKVSDTLFDNLKVLPFIASISLLILTYFFTIQLSSKRISGLVAVVIILQSHLFTFFDTTVTYANFWVVFYLLSLYLVKKSWPISSLSYVASIFAKTLTLAYLPYTLFYIARSDISFRKKFFSLIFYMIIFIVIALTIFLIFPESEYYPSKVIFHPPRFFSGFSILPFQLRFDFLIMAFLFPLNVLLYKKSKQGQKYAQSLQILISGVILSGPLLTGFFNYQLNPYRLIPLVVFFAIGFGLLFKRTHLGRIR